MNEQTTTINLELLYINLYILTTCSYIVNELLDTYFIINIYFYIYMYYLLLQYSYA